MRIAVLDDRYPEVYGAQENVLLLSELCRDAGHDPVFVTIAPGRLATEAQRRGLETLVVPAPARLLQFERAAVTNGPLRAARSAFDLALYNLSLARSLRRIQPDLVLVSAVRPALLLIATRLLLRRPIVLYAQNSIPFGWFAAAAGLISHRIALIADGARSTFPPWFDRRFQARYAALPSGRDFTRFDRAPRDTEAAATHDHCPLELVTICSITKRKGLHDLVEVLDRLRAEGIEARLTVVGSTTGPQSEIYLERLRSRIDEIDVDVCFAGWQDDVVPFLQASEMFVLASYDEGLPGVLLEAMAVGLPCVTTGAGGAGELVEQCGAGRVVPVGDVASLTASIADLARDPVARREAGDAGYRGVREEYGLDAFLQRFEDLAVPLVAGDGMSR